MYFDNIGGEMLNAVPTHHTTAALLQHSSDPDVAHSVSSSPHTTSNTPATHTIQCHHQTFTSALTPKALKRLKPFGKVVLCGAISQYNVDTNPKDLPGIPANLAASMVSNRIRMQGFIVTDHAKVFPQAIKVRDHSSITKHHRAFREHLSAS
jgi:NADPH-dependent curcumin reductase CurA